MSAITATASPSPAAAHLRALHAGRRNGRGRRGSRPPSRPPAVAQGRVSPAWSGSRRSVRISASAAAARSSIGTPSPIAPGSASSWSTTLAQAGIDCEVGAAGRCPWRGPQAHHPARRGSARMTCSRSAIAAAGSHDIIPIDRCPILDPGSERRDRGGLGARRAADRRSASRSTSRSPRPIAA